MVVADFEGGIAGWTAWDPFTFTATSTGATSGSGAMEIAGDAGDWQNNGLGDIKAGREMLGKPGARILIDITAFAADMTTGWFQVHLVINAQNNDNNGANNNVGWVDVANIDIQRDGVAHTYRYDVPEALRQQIAATDDTIEWFELVLGSNLDGASNVKYYVDNIRVEIDDVEGPSLEPYVLGDWEQDLDNWVLQGNNTHTFTTTGATLNEYALAVYMPLPDWQEPVRLDINAAPNRDEILQALKDGRYIQVDLTRLVADFPGGADDGGHSGLHFIFNAGGDGWDNWHGSDYFNWWPRANGDDIGSTVTWEYLSVLEDMDLDNIGYFEFTLVPNFATSYGSGTYIFDNLRILPRLKATSPEPADGATDVDRKVVLDWYEGAHIVGHEVYIGTSLGDVSAVNQDNLGDFPEVTFQARGPEESMLDMGTLDLGTTYYWRADQVGDSNNVGTKTGDVWSFTVADYITLEDFESYADAAALSAAWPDSNDLSTDPVNGGSQAMKAVFDNTAGPYYTELSYNLPDDVKDLTQQGVRGLGIHFYGDPNNKDEPMYVLLEDAGSKSDIVFYDGDPENLKKEEWQIWQIGLPRFDVNLTDVKRIAIGFGDPENPTAGTAGEMHFDDIRVFLGRCILSERTGDFAGIDIFPLGFAAGDCLIGFGELMVIGRDWLAQDAILAASVDDPNSQGGGLVAHYKLDEGEGTTTAESVAGIENGTFNGGVTWVTPGHDGTGAAINVDGTSGSMVQIGTWDPAAGTGEMTISLWIRWSGSDTPGIHGIIGKRDSWGDSGAMRWFLETGPNGDIRLRQHDSGGVDLGWGTEGLLDPYIGTWIHLAVTFDGATARVYVNGVEVISGTFVLANMVDASMGIGNTHGAGNTGSEEVFNGQIDEVQIYNRALSVDEVRYLADLTPGDGELYVPVPSQADFSSDEPAGQKSINLKDLGALGLWWWMDQTWPF